MTRLLFVLLITGLAGCAVTEQSKPTGLDTPQAARFLGDYSQLQPGQKDQANLVYINPNVNWKRYNSVLLEPVQVWDSPDRKISPDDQKMLSSYYYNVLKENLSKHFTMAGSPGPGVMTVRVALTDATTATPVLRTVSVVVPQARLLNSVKNLTTGSYGFVGSAQSEIDADGA